MVKIYGNRWITKNGNRPNDLWDTQLAAMSAEQLRRVANACIERCAAGNAWPPDFAEFIALNAEFGGGRLGLTAADVLDELTRWRNESWLYESADKFPWHHPVLYHICIELRRTSIDRKLTQPEEKKLAASLLERWEKKIGAGYSVPPIARRIASPRHPPGPTPAQVLISKAKKN